MAIGRGDWFGVGLGKGLMKLGYLPDAHTDVIFAVIIEEMGLITAIILVATLFFLCFRCFLIGKKALNRGQHFGFFLSYGVAILIGLHTLINVGVATGLLPTKGLPLPFVSVGGSSMIITMAAVGILLNISRQGSGWVTPDSQSKDGSFFGSSGEGGGRYSKGV